MYDEPKLLRVRFDHKSYQTSGPDGGGERVQPFGMFVIPRTDKPIVLEENTQGLIGKPCVANTHPDPGAR